MKMSFREWMRKVDKSLVIKCGMDNRDLPDYHYRDEYDNGATAAGCAARALKNAGGYY